jgi:hypothetical protein
VELVGTLVENLRAAVHSSRRLRGQRVYPETLQFWIDLLELARTEQDTAAAPEAPALADQLEHELRHRRGPP